MIRMHRGVVVTVRMVAGILLLALALCIVVPPLIAADPPQLDGYGGYADYKCPEGIRPTFYVSKIGQRWVLCTPEGSVFWMRSVYHATNAFLDPSVVAAKYGGNASLWATQRNRRLLTWGFNVLGEYSSTLGLPVGVYGKNQGDPIKLPFILLLNSIGEGMTNYKRNGFSQPIKDVMKGVPQTTYSGYRGKLADPYDPQFEKAVRWSVDYWTKAITGGFADKSWVVGITLDDADLLFGFKSDGSAALNAYPHPGYLVACAKPQYSGAEHPDGMSWKDSKLYAKEAWISFLKQKYPTIKELNSAWGTGGYYKSFESSGGYGSGVGVMDEDGRHTGWLGISAVKLTGAKPGFLADIDSFLYEFAKRYATVSVSVVRASDRNHLIFGPAALNNYGAEARAAVLKGLDDGGIDVFQFNYDPSYGPDRGSMAGNNWSYDQTGKPAFIWYNVAANADSPLAAYRSTVPYEPQFPTQAQRALQYSIDIPNFINARGSNGDYYVVGFDWWELIDSPPTREKGNWGLITNRDNAYDGKEARVAAGVDPQGYRTGGEIADYGDFLGPVSAVNQGIVRLLEPTLPPARPKNVRTKYETAVP